MAGNIDPFRKRNHSVPRNRFWEGLRLEFDLPRWRETLANEGILLLKVVNFRSPLGESLESVVELKENGFM